VASIRHDKSGNHILCSGRDKKKYTSVLLFSSLCPSLLQVLNVKSQLQWGEQEARRGRKGSINRVLRAEHPLEIDSEVWWDVKKEQITSKYCRRSEGVQFTAKAIFILKNIRSLLPFFYKKTHHSVHKIKLKRILYFVKT
jgi:hypothetical protein